MKNRISNQTQFGQTGFSNQAAQPRPPTHNISSPGKPIGDICLEIAEFAKDRDYRTLDHLMRMAATEAYEQTSAIIPTVPIHRNELIGLWDWDVPNNRNYLDPKVPSYLALIQRKPSTVCLWNTT